MDSLALADATNVKGEKPGDSKAECLNKNKGGREGVCDALIEVDETISSKGEIDYFEISTMAAIADKWGKQVKVQR